MLNIVERLDRTRFSPGVCVSRKGGELDRVVQKLGIPFIEAPFTVPPRPYVTLLWRAWRASRAVLRQWMTGSNECARRGQAHSALPTTPRRSFCAKAGPHSPLIWHSFNYSDDYTEPLIARMSGARAWVYTKKNMGWGSRAWLLRSYLASGIAAQNTAMLDQFFCGRERKARHIPPGVDVELFQPGPPDPHLRQSWGFAPDTFLLGHVAQVIPVKNHEHLLKALARVKSKIGLLLAGAELDSAYAAHLRELAAALGVQVKVRFCGKVSDIPGFLHTVDGFVFCSLREACPVAALEAMACQLASTVTDIPAMRDIHIPGATALVVPPDDVEAFASALDRLSSDPNVRRQLGEAARRRVVFRFNLDQETKRYTELYNALFRHKATRDWQCLEQNGAAG
jgi:glycosyltransferase involved in cell wall biosynthesis